MAEYEQVERHEGVFTPTGDTVKFKRVWGKNDHWPGKRFTDEELVQLLDGEEISFEATSKEGKPYTAKGKLAPGVFNGHPYWAFTLDTGGIPASFLGHTFSPAEIADLEAGKRIDVEGFWSERKQRKFDATVSYGVKEGESQKSLIFHFDN